MQSVKSCKVRMQNRQATSRTFIRLLVADILPILLLLLAMAFGMAYVAQKASDRPAANERATHSSVSVVIG